MASMAFDIFARDHASRVFDKVGDNAERLGRRIQGAGSSTGGLSAHMRELDGASNGLSGTLGRISSQMGSLAGSAVSLAGKAAVGASALATLGAAAASAAGYTVALAASIAPLSGLLAGLPGLAVTGAAAFGVWKMATMGLADAMSAALEFNDEKLAKAVSKMSDAGRQFSGEFLAMRKDFIAFRDISQDAFLQPILGQLQRWLTSIQQLGPAIAGLAGEFGALVRAALDFATAERTLGQFGVILYNTQALLAAVRGSLEPLLRGFVDLGVQGNMWLSAFAPSLRNVLTTFGEWMSEVSRSGQAFAWLNAAADVLRQLGTLVKDVWTLFTGLLKAASDAGANALGVLGSLVGAMSDWVNSTKGQETLVEIFRALNDIGRALMPVVTALVGALATIAPEAAKVATALGPVLASAITALGAGIAAMWPGLVKMVEGLGRAVAGVGPLLEPLGAALGEVFAELGTALALIIPEIGKIALALAPALAAAIRALGPALAALGPGLTAVAEMLARAFAAPEMQRGLLQLGKGLADVLIAAAPLLPVIGQLAGILAQVLGGALTNLGVLLRPIIEALGRALEPALRAISDALNLLIPLMAPVYKAFGDIGAALIDQLLPPLLDLIPVVINSLIPAFAEIARQIQPLIPLLAALAVKFINDVLPGLLPILPELTRLSVEFARMGVALATLVVTIAPYIERIIQIFQYLYDRLVGHSIIPDLINGMTQWFRNGVQWIQGIVGWFGQLPGMIGAWLGSLVNVVQAKWAEIRNAIAGKVEEIKNAVAQKIGDMLAVFRDLPGRITGTLGNLGGLLYESGRSIIGGLINGLYSMLQGAYNAAADILGRIRSLFPSSPAKEGPFSGKGWTLFSGRSMAEGLAKGLLGGQDLVGSAAEALMGAASLSLSPQAPVSVGAGMGGVVPLTPQGGGVTINLSFAGQPLIGRDEITRMVVAALNEARGRGFNLGFSS